MTVAGPPLPLPPPPPPPPEEDEEESQPLTEDEMDAELDRIEMEEKQSDKD